MDFIRLGRGQIRLADGLKPSYIEETINPLSFPRGASSRGCETGWMKAYYDT